MDGLTGRVGRGRLSELTSREGCDSGRLVLGFCCAFSCSDCIFAACAYERLFLTFTICIFLAFLASRQPSKAAEWVPTTIYTYRSFFSVTFLKFVVFPASDASHLCFALSYAVAVALAFKAPQNGGNV